VHVKAARKMLVKLYTGVDNNKKRKSSSLQMNRDLSGDILDEITDDFVMEIEKEDRKDEDKSPSFYKTRVQVKKVIS
jgi:hypothetical protein